MHIIRNTTCIWKWQLSSYQRNNVQLLYSSSSWYIYMCMMCLPQLQTYILWLAQYLKSVSTYIGLTMPWEDRFAIQNGLFIYHSIPKIGTSYYCDDISHLLHSIVTEMFISWEDRFCYSECPVYIYILGYLTNNNTFSIGKCKTVCECSYLWL